MPQTAISTRIFLRCYAVLNNTAVVRLWDARPNWIAGVTSVTFFVGITLVGVAYIFVRDLFAFIISLLNGLLALFGTGFSIPPSEFWLGIWDNLCQATLIILLFITAVYALYSCLRIRTSPDPRRFRGIIPVRPFTRDIFARRVRQPSLWSRLFPSGNKNPPDTTTDDEDNTQNGPIVPPVPSNSPSKVQSVLLFLPCLVFFLLAIYALYERKSSLSSALQGFELSVSLPGPSGTAVPMPVGPKPATSKAQDDAHSSTSRKASAESSSKDSQKAKSATSSSKANQESTCKKQSSLTKDGSSEHATIPRIAEVLFTSAVCREHSPSAEEVPTDPPTSESVKASTSSRKISFKKLTKNQSPSKTDKYTASEQQMKASSEDTSSSELVRTTASTWTEFFRKLTQSKKQSPSTSETSVPSEEESSQVEKASDEISASYELVKASPSSRTSFFSKLTKSKRQSSSTSKTSILSEEQSLPVAKAFAENSPSSATVKASPSSRTAFFKKSTKAKKESPSDKTTSSENTSESQSVKSSLSSEAKKQAASQPEFFPAPSSQSSSSQKLSPSQKQPILSENTSPDTSSQQKSSKSSSSSQSPSSEKWNLFKKKPTWDITVSSEAASKSGPVKAAASSRSFTSNKSITSKEQSTSNEEVSSETISESESMKESSASQSSSCRKSSTSPEESSRSESDRLSPSSPFLSHGTSTTDESGRPYSLAESKLLQRIGYVLGSLANIVFSVLRIPLSLLKIFSAIFYNVQCAVARESSCVGSALLNAIYLTGLFLFVATSHYAIRYLKGLAPNAFGIVSTIILYQPIFWGIIFSLGRFIPQPIGYLISQLEYHWYYNRYFVSFLVMASFKGFKGFVHIISYYLYTRPAQPPVHPTITPADVTVIIPTVGDFGADFQTTLLSVLENAPKHVIIATVGLHKVQVATPVIESLPRSYTNRTSITVDMTLVPNKRSQFLSAVSKARTSIICYADDHVMWPSTFLHSALACFEDPHVGMVGTIKAAKRVRDKGWVVNLLNYVGCIYLERHNFECTATYNIDGGVFVISGRTGFIRRDIVSSLDFRTGFLNEYWSFGPFQTNTPMKPDDDNYMTRYCVNNGWKTVFHNDPKACITTSIGTEADKHGSHINKLRGQLLRWARTTWRSNLFSLFIDRVCWRVYPWTTYAMFISSFVNLACIYDPLMLYFLWLSGPQSKLFCGVVLLLFLSKCVKPLQHFLREPKDVWLLPFGIAFGYAHSFVRLYALWTVTDVEWSGRDLGTARQ